MRTVLFVAAFLASQGAASAAGPADGGRAPALEGGAARPSAFDTTVHSLKHGHARQVAARVDDALRKEQAERASRLPQGAAEAPSVVVIPTTAEDAVVTICPRDQVHRVHELIAACDVPRRQFAVKLVLLEVTPDGKNTLIARPTPAIPLGESGTLHLATDHAEGTIQIDANARDGIKVSILSGQSTRAVQAGHPVAQPGVHSQPSPPIGRGYQPSPSGCTDGEKQSCTAVSACEAEGCSCQGACGGRCDRAGCKCPATSKSDAEGNPGTGPRTSGLQRVCPHAKAGETHSEAACRAPHGQAAYEPMSDCPAAVPLLTMVPAWDRLFRHVAAICNPSCCEAPAADASSGRRHAPAHARAAAHAHARTASSEPPAFVTLSDQHDDSFSADDALGAVAAQAGRQPGLVSLRGFAGRRLSDVFEPRGAARDSALPEVGRLLAEIPKRPGPHGAPADLQSLIVVDFPDRVRIFEDVATPAGAEPAPCASCHEEFRAFLEDFFRSSEMADAGRPSGSLAGSADVDEPRELPNVPHSKIETTVVTYPLRDLVLLDDAGHPVFDTCTIIDHLQSAVEPQSWTNPRVSIQLDQQSVSLVIRQTAEVHRQIESHLRYLRRLQIKQICSLIERMSCEPDAKSLPQEAEGQRAGRSRFPASVAPPAAAGAVPAGAQIFAPEGPALKSP
jgi:hypothetical protein